MVSPLAYMLKTNSTLEWYYEIAAELVAAKPKKLDATPSGLSASPTREITVSPTLVASSAA